MQLIYTSTPQLDFEVEIIYHGKVRYKIKAKDETEAQQFAQEMFEVHEKSDYEEDAEVIDSTTVTPGP